MYTAGNRASRRVLVVRLGAMGDILHTLPAVAFLKRSCPECEITWLVEPRWRPLLDGNPTLDRVLTLQRSTLAGLLETRRQLRAMRFDAAMDFQGLLKSALSSRASGAPERIGFVSSQLREPLAAAFYTRTVSATATHVVDRNLELAAAYAGFPAAGTREFPLPDGASSAHLPAEPFVLASPLAGWASKQWPMEHYRDLAVLLRAELGLQLVLDGPPGADFSLAADAIPHYSSLPQLIYTTRRAAAVVGVDSGPLHLAAALGKPGVAIFGPTDPARNGPYGGTLRVLRTAGVETTYKRGAAIDESMRRITPAEVFAALRDSLGRRTEAGK